MANSRFEYVKRYEHDPPLLPGCFIVVRVDGRGFTKFSDLHGFEKPNDARGLDLMDRAAREV
jgi:tRNA(His) guanylyltransferase